MLVTYPWGRFIQISSFFPRQSNFVCRCSDTPQSLLVHIVLAPLMVLAIPVVWIRTSSLTKARRIVLITCLVLLWFALGLALDFHLYADKLMSLQTESAQRARAEDLRQFMWYFVLSVAMAVAFVVIWLHGVWGSHHKTRQS